MKVAKFGGGCLRGADDFLRVGEILKKESEGDIIVVASAIYGVTDTLSNSIKNALKSDSDIPLTIANLKSKHLEIVQVVIKDEFLRGNVQKLIEERLERLERLLYGIAYIGEVSDSVRVLVLSQGERLSVAILSGVLRDNDIDSIALESEQIGLLTDDQYENATAIFNMVETNLKKHILPLLSRGILPIITGFFGCNHLGQPTSFGRNGSDYSAAVVAAALHANTLDIWKDVDGFMTTDPKITGSAIPIKSLSYCEAAELSYFGAKILHPRTVEPLRGSDIEICIKNVDSPERVYTRIRSAGQRERDIIKSIAFRTDISVLRVHGAGVGYKPGIIGEIGRILALANVNILSVITSQTCINLLLDSHDSFKSQEALAPLIGGVIGAIDVRDDVALIAVVGEGLLTTKGLAARVFSAVAEKEVNIEMFSAGASEVAYYFIVRHEDMNLAINAVHRCFFESRPNT